MTEDRLEVDFTGLTGEIYVALAYGEATDYLVECWGISNCPENVRPGNPPENCSVAVTRMERAKELPHAIYELM